jgi:hypothetical protein
VAQVVVPVLGHTELRQDTLEIAGGDRRMHRLPPLKTRLQGLDRLSAASCSSICLV